MKLLFENWRRFIKEDTSESTVDEPGWTSQEQFDIGMRDWEDERPLIDKEKQKFITSYSLSDDPDVEHGAHAQAWIRALSDHLPAGEDPTEHYRDNVMPGILSRVSQAGVVPMEDRMFDQAAAYYDVDGIHMPDIFTDGEPTPQGDMIRYFDASPYETEENLTSYFSGRHPKYWSLDGFVQHMQDLTAAREEHGRQNAEGRWGRTWAHEYGHQEDSQGPAHLLRPREEVQAEEELEAMARDIWGEEYDESPSAEAPPTHTMSGVQKEKFNELFPWLDELDPEEGSAAHYERRHEIYASLMKNRQLMDDAYRRGERDTPMITAEDVEAWMMGPDEAREAQAQHIRDWGRGQSLRARLSDATCRATRADGQCPSFIGSPMHRRKHGWGDVLKALWTSSPRGRSVRDEDGSLGWPEGKVGTGHPSRTEFPALELGNEEIADILNSIARAEPAQPSDPTMIGEPTRDIVAESNMAPIFENWRRFINENQQVLYVDINLLLPTEELGHGKDHDCPSSECEAAVQDKMGEIKGGKFEPIEVANQKPVKTYKLQGQGVDIAPKSGIPEPFYHVLDGHHRLEAAKRLGLQSVPVFITAEESG